MKNSLWGDGIHDDYPAIQEMLDSKRSLVYLPAPEKCYIISKTLKIHSGQTLRLDRTSIIKLMDNGNCLMLKNANPEQWDSTICLEGGIWDMNNTNQAPNPLHYPYLDTGRMLLDLWKESNYDPDQRLYFKEYFGVAIQFNCVRNLIIKDLTIKNPVTFGIQMAYIEQFTVENIYFDYTTGGPKLKNMDGVHLDGCCRHGVIRNLHGACHDDLVALNADDLLRGPIENILVDGIYADHCHSAVRMLSFKSMLRNVHITNVFGTYYVYCISLSKYYGHENSTGLYDNITIDNVYASKCHGTPDVDGSYSPFINIENGLFVKRLQISNVSRNEEQIAKPTICVEKGSHINTLVLENITQRNKTGQTMPLLSCEGLIDNLYMRNLDADKDPLVSGSGTIHSKNT